jgi:hypothetical protein
VLQSDRTCYEYMVTGLLTEEGLNKLGADGWELVGTREMTLYFIRERLSG